MADPPRKSWHFNFNFFYHLNNLRKLVKNVTFWNTRLKKAWHPVRQLEAIWYLFWPDHKSHVLLCYVDPPSIVLAQISVNPLMNCVSLHWSRITINICCICIKSDRWCMFPCYVDEDKCMFINPMATLWDLFTFCCE